MRFNRAFLPKSIRRYAYWKARRLAGLGETGRATFSQEGEDLIAARLLGLEEGRDIGFYVDVGAHHPERYSNTFYFYNRGWTGINIDPRPGLFKEFQAHRPRDVTLELAISDHAGSVEYIIFKEPALNGCDEHTANMRISSGHAQIQERVRVNCKPLAEVLAEHLPANTDIDFLTVDVEGHDAVVMRSNDWAKYRPKLIMIEDGTVATLEHEPASEIGEYLRSVGYVGIAKAAATIFYAERERVVKSPFGFRVK